jgi:hypothetical protein
MAAVYRCENKTVSIQRVRTVLKKLFGASAEHGDFLLQQVSESMTEAASALGMRVGEQNSFDAVLREVNLRLAEDNLSYEELNWRTQQALAERDKFADELHFEQELAREVQKSLLPACAARFPNVIGLNVTAKALSGGFYKYYPLTDGRSAFCLADVAGKVINAALLMAKASSLFRCLGNGFHDPAKLLQGDVYTCMRTSCASPARRPAPGERRAVPFGEGAVPPARPGASWRHRSGCTGVRRNSRRRFDPGDYPGTAGMELDEHLVSLTFSAGRADSSCCGPQYATRPGRSDWTMTRLMRWVRRSMTRA